MTPENADELIPAYDLDPELHALIVEVVYDGVLARPGLDLKTRELLAVTALMGIGGKRA